MLPHALKGVEANIIPTSYVLQGDLKPTIHGLLLEDSALKFANVIAVRTGDENRLGLIALKKAMTSEKMSSTSLKSARVRS